MSYIPAKVTKLREVYGRCLLKAVDDHPGDYPWANHDIKREMIVECVNHVVNKMMDRAQTNIYLVGTDGFGWKYAAKELGIKNTKKAWSEWLETE